MSITSPSISTSRREPRSLILDRRRPYAVELAGGELPTNSAPLRTDRVERSLLLVVEHFGSGTAMGRMRARGELLCALNALLVPHDQRRGESGRQQAQLDRATALMRARVAGRVTGRDLERAAGLGSTRASCPLSRVDRIQPHGLFAPDACRSRAGPPGRSISKHQGSSGAYRVRGGEPLQPRFQPDRRRATDRVSRCAVDQTVDLTGEVDIVACYSIIVS